MNGWMDEYDLSDAVTETVAGTLYRSSKMELSVSEEMTQRTSES